MSINEFLASAKKTIDKKSQVTEADIEDTFCKFAKRNKCNALKLVFLRKKGFPDRTVLCPNGRVLFIEFKRNGKPLSPAQVLVKVMLTGFGFEYHVCDRIGQAENILGDFLVFDS